LVAGISQTTRAVGLTLLVNKANWFYPQRLPFPSPRGNSFSQRLRIMGLVLLIVLILLVVGALPNFGYHCYGYAPSGLLGVVALILVVMFLTGRL